MQRTEYKVTSQRCLDGGFSRFVVSNFADQNDVRVMTKDGSQTSGERQTDSTVNLNLADAVELVFDRIFNRDDLGVSTANFVQTAVKRRLLSATRWAGYQHDAVRQADQLLEGLVNWVRHAHAAQVKDHPAFVENTKDDAFAVQHRDD